MAFDIEDVEEYQKKFNERILWIQKNIPPDDIYFFSHCVLLAAEFFIYRLAERENVNESMKTDPDLKHWVRMILGVTTSQMNNRNFMMDVDWKNPSKL